MRISIPTIGHILKMRNRNNGSQIFSKIVVVGSFIGVVVTSALLIIFSELESFMKTRHPLGRKPSRASRTSQRRWRRGRRSQRRRSQTQRLLSTSSGTSPHQRSRGYTSTTRKISRSLATVLRNILTLSDQTVLDQVWDKRRQAQNFSDEWMFINCDIHTFNKLYIYLC